jgi:ubiquitin-protein ligase
MPPSAVNKTTLKRINKEIADIQKAQKSGEMGDILLQPNESNMHLWTGWLPGPPGSPYEGGHFEISIELPKDYP